MEEKKPIVQHDRLQHDRVTEIRLDYLEENIREISKTLYNDGQGIVYDVKQLKNNAQSNSGRVTSVINVISVAISFVVMLLLILEKMK